MLEGPSVASPVTVEVQVRAVWYLGGFFTGGNRRRLEWPLAKDKRAHVHRRIDGYGPPVSHVTTRTGRRYTLVLVKTTALFVREAELRKSMKRDVT